MSIWTYEHLADDVTVPPLLQSGELIIGQCIYCEDQHAEFLVRRDTDFGSWDQRHSQLGEGKREFLNLESCPSCGWWLITRDRSYYDSNEWWREICRYWGALRNLDVTDISLPLEELQGYLTLRYDERYRVDPFRYEDLVSGVFGEWGYRVRATGYSKDGGIDIFVLDGSGRDQIGVQVKRWKGKIGVDQIRSFEGALRLNDVTEGIYVTTSDFTAGARRAASEFTRRGIRIELQNGNDFFDKLRAVQRRQYTSAEDPSAPFRSIWENPPHRMPVACFGQNHVE